MTTRYQRHPDVRLTDLAGEGVVLHLGARRYFTVNATGLAILEALVSPQSVDDLVAAVRREFDVSEADAVATTRAFVQQCLDAHVIGTVGE